MPPPAKSGDGGLVLAGLGLGALIFFGTSAKRGRSRPGAGLHGFADTPRKPGNGLLIAGAGALALLALSRTRAGTEVVDDIIEAGSGFVERLNMAMTLPVAGRQYVDVFQRVGRELGVDPALIAALMEQESYYGSSKFLDQPGPAGRGDGGHGHGLMQIDDRFHQAFLAKRNAAGVPLWQVPYENVKYAIGQVYLPYRRFLAAVGGNIPNVTATRSNRRVIVVGPKSLERLKDRLLGSHAPGDYPDPRPLAGADLNHAALNAYNAGLTSVLQMLALGYDADRASFTRQYGTQVRNRWRRIAGDPNLA